MISIKPFARRNASHAGQGRTLFKSPHGTANYRTRFFHDTSRRNIKVAKEEYLKNQEHKESDLKEILFHLCVTQGKYVSCGSKKCDRHQLHKEVVYNQRQREELEEAKNDPEILISWIKKAYQGICSIARGRTRTQTRFEHRIQHRLFKLTVRVVWCHCAVCHS